LTVAELDTPHGPARVHLHPVDEPRAALVLGHGAGGGVAARDLVAATDAANGAGVSVALVEMPYRVAGRRSPPRAPVLDADWVAISEQLGSGSLRGLPLIAGGRSSGARVACRTAAATGVIAVLCLAFPLVAPSGVSRQEELDGAGVPCSSCRA
jgi:predicted alpha/beta-hydrolase family hydrolase